MQIIIKENLKEYFVALINKNKVQMKVFPILKLFYKHFVNCICTEELTSLFGRFSDLDLEEE